MQQGIEEGWLPELSWLMGLDAAAFYDDDIGTNDGQARYLLYYLQEHDLLLPYYTARKAQPEGTAALEAVLKIDDIAAWEHAVWRPYVMTLTEP